MVLTFTKLIKISIPILSSIAGVIVTSSLVSKSAEDKEEKKILTKLKDEDPIIEEYEDANEGKCKKNETNNCEGGGPKGQQGKQGESGGGGGGTSSDVDQSLPGSKGGSTEDSKQQSDIKTESEKKEDEDKSSAQEEQSSGPEKSSDGDSESPADDNEKGKDGITDSGSEEAEHNNALGTKFGSEDRRMTTQEIGSLKDTQSSLKNVLSELSAMFKGV